MWNMHQVCPDPPHFPTKCDGCSAPFTFDHALSCNVGNSVTQRHDLIRDEIAEWASHAFQKSDVTIEPFDAPASDKNRSQRRCDVGVRGLFRPGQLTLVDITVINTECKTHLKHTPEKVILKAEADKRRKHGREIREARRHFAPFAMTTDGCLGPSAVTVVRKIASALADKTGIHYSVLVSRIRAGVSFAAVRAIFANCFGERQRVGSRRPRPFMAGLGLNAFRW